ncbi:MAG: arylesterase [Vicinamibacterales bacterium]
MRRHWLAAIAMVGASACETGGCRPTVEIVRDPAPAQVTKTAGESSRPRIVALGDSLTAGLGLVESEAYPTLLQQKLDAEGYDFDVVNAGVSGDTSAGGLRRLDWALDGDVKILVVALGANDALRGLSIDEMKQNLTTIIERAQERGVAVLLAGMEAPPNYGPEYTVKFRQVYRDLARTHRVVFVPFLLDGVAGQARLNQGDGIHPNAEGARQVAETIWRALRPMADAATATP